MSQSLNLIAFQSYDHNEGFYFHPDVTHQAKLTPSPACQLTCPYTTPDMKETTWGR